MFSFCNKIKWKVRLGYIHGQGILKLEKMDDGKNCAFLTHMGKDSNSAYNFAVRCFENLKNNMGHIEKVMEK
jgi:hypothetical protein